LRGCQATGGTHNKPRTVSYGPAVQAPVLTFLPAIMPPRSSRTRSASRAMTLPITASRKHGRTTVSSALASSANGYRPKRVFLP